MTIEVNASEIRDGLVYVNQKEVRRDMNGNWIGHHLNITEATVFRDFITMQEQITIKIKTAVFSTR